MLLGNILPWWSLGSERASSWSICCWTDRNGMKANCCCWNEPVVGTGTLKKRMCLMITPFLLNSLTRSPVSLMAEYLTYLLRGSLVEYRDCVIETDTWHWTSNAWSITNEKTNSNYTNESAIKRKDPLSVCLYQWKRTVIMINRGRRRMDWPTWIIFSSSFLQARWFTRGHYQWMTEKRIVSDAVRALCTSSEWIDYEQWERERVHNREAFDKVAWNEIRFQGVKMN